MQLRATTSWTTRTGKVRRVRLFESWRNLKGRVKGSKSARESRHCWLGKPVEWKSWQDFRTWALAAGYSKHTNSIDRINPKDGYTAANCRWVTCSQNSAYVHALRRANEAQAA